MQWGASKPVHATSALHRESTLTYIFSSTPYAGRSGCSVSVGVLCTGRPCPPSGGRATGREDGREAKRKDEREAEREDAREYDRGWCWT